MVSLGVISTLIYLYSKLWVPGDIDRYPAALMVLTFFISAWGQRRQLQFDLIFRLLVLSFVIPPLLFAINYLIDPASAVKYQVLDRLAKFFFWLPVAWWMGGSAVAARRMLVVVLLGFVTAILVDPNLSQTLEWLWEGKRVDFGIRNAQHAALFFGLILTFMLCRFNLLLKRACYPWKAGFPIVGTALCLIGLWSTQTRAAYLALFICALLFLVIRFRAKPRIITRPAIPVGLLAALCIIGFLVIEPAGKIIEERFAQERQSVEMLISGDIEQLPFTSIGVRVHSWMESLHWIAKRPLTGWGLAARSDVIDLAENFPDEVKADFGHLHNGYLELLIGYGLIGFIFSAVLWVTLIRRTSRIEDSGLRAFALYGGVFFLVMNLFESYFMFWTGVYAMAVIFSGAYTLYLRDTLSAELNEATV